MTPLTKLKQGYAARYRESLPLHKKPFGLSLSKPERLARHERP
jgi:hypothetical protein